MNIELVVYLKRWCSAKYNTLGTRRFINLLKLALQSIKFERFKNVQVNVATKLVRMLNVH